MQNKNNVPSGRSWREFGAIAATSAVALIGANVAHGGQSSPSAENDSPAVADTANTQIQGGNVYEQEQVKEALAASSFPWSILPETTVDISSDTPPVGGDAIPGQINLYPELLDAGEFSWGVILHEMGHQVDFMLLNDDDRAYLLSILGGQSWYQNPSDQAQILHQNLGSERFADLMAWAFWPSQYNSMDPNANSLAGHSTDAPYGISVNAFRALLFQVLSARLAADGAPQSQINLLAKACQPLKTPAPPKKIQSAPKKISPPKTKTISKSFR